MATIRINAASANALLTQLLAELDNGAGPATLKIYTGTMPADPDTAVTTQTLLGTLTCSEPTGSVASRSLTFGSITQDSSADNNGTATWARLLDGAGTAVVDVDISTTGGSGFLKLNTTTIIAGGPIAVSSFVITL